MPLLLLLDWEHAICTPARRNQCEQQQTLLTCTQTTQTNEDARTSATNKCVVPHIESSVHPELPQRMPPVQRRATCGNSVRNRSVFTRVTNHMTSSRADRAVSTILVRISFFSSRKDFVYVLLGIRRGIAWWPNSISSCCRIRSREVAVQIPSST
jgi:hypothetical protein